MKRARLTITTLALLTLALPASAGDCQQLTIDDRPGIAEVIDSGEGVYTAVVGRFLWVNIGDEPPTAGREWEGTVMVDLSDLTISGVTVCPDGTVTLERESPEPRPETETETSVEPAPAPEPEVVDLEEVWGPRASWSRNYPV